MKVEFHPAADSELRAAAKYYNDRVSGLGAEFLAEVEKACLRLGEHQALGPRLDADHDRVPGSGVRVVSLGALGLVLS